MVNPRTLQRIESRIHERAAYCLQFEIKDPRSTFVTVTRVELDTDLKSGKIFWSCLGSDADRKKTERMLKDAAGFIQRQIARVLDTRTVPHLGWHYDDSISKAAELDQLIANARAQDEKIRPREVRAAEEQGSETEDSEAENSDADDDE